MIVGHSCGATLAMQVVMGVWNGDGDKGEKKEGDFPMPTAGCLAWRGFMI